MEITKDIGYSHITMVTEITLMQDGWEIHTNIEHITTMMEAISKMRYATINGDSPKRLKRIFGWLQ